MRLNGFYFNLMGVEGGGGYMVDKTVMNTWGPCIGSMACAHVHACTCASNSQSSVNPAHAIRHKQYPQFPSPLPNPRTQSHKPQSPRPKSGDGVGGADATDKTSI